MKIEIEKATLDHINDLACIHSKSWKTAYKDIIPDNVIENFTQLEQRINAFTEMLTKRHEELYLFKADGIPAGFSMLFKDHEENAPSTSGEIYAIYFLPEYWGTDITHRGFQFSIDRLRDMGFERINIVVLEDNNRARKFYEKYDFEIAGHKKVIILGKPLKEIIYTKQLD